MTATHDIEKQIFAQLADQIDLARQLAVGSPFVGFAKLGGIGDLMQCTAFARAVRRRYPTAHFLLVFKNLGEDADGNSLVHNIAGDVFQTVLEIPQLGWWRVMTFLFDRFDVFFDVQYCIGSYYKRPEDALFQVAALARMQRFQKYYGDFVPSNQQLEDLGMTQWEIMAASSGLDVAEDDLRIEIHHKDTERQSTQREEPGEGSEESSIINHQSSIPLPVVESKRYVTIHISPGGSAVMKSPPIEYFQAMVDVLRQCGVEMVQVGSASEALLEDVTDCRGLSINATAEAIACAGVHIDIEGGIAYVAKAVGTPAAILFGPTPISVFGFTGNLNLTRGACRPCWHHHPCWSRFCHRGYAFCQNFPALRTTLREIRRFVMRQLQRGDAENAETDAEKREARSDETRNLKLER